MRERAGAKARLDETNVRLEAFHREISNKLLGISSLLLASEDNVIRLDGRRKRQPGVDANKILIDIQQRIIGLQARLIKLERHLLSDWRRACQIGHKCQVSQKSLLPARRLRA